MKESLKRILEKDKVVYVIDYWGYTKGSKAIVTSATILDVDYKHKILVALLYGDTYNRYKFEDYGRLIFNTETEANTFASKIPDPGSIIFQIIGTKVYSKSVRNIRGKNDEGCHDLVIEFDRGSCISTKELGHTIFSKREEARKQLANMNDETVMLVKESCTCCNDVYKILEISGNTNHTGIILYKTKIVNTNRDSSGWCYYLTAEDDKYPIVITENAANAILKDHEKALNLVYNRWFDRYK
ncbi:MAG: hypothetical protein J6M60_04175 [Clostridia bacterium]|nr:hypothetical protein [Clostridia bacterium]